VNSLRTRATESGILRREKEVKSGSTAACSAEVSAGECEDEPGVVRYLIEITFVSATLLASMDDGFELSSVSSTMAIVARTKITIADALLRSLASLRNQQPNYTAPSPSVLGCRYSTYRRPVLAWYRLRGLMGRKHLPSHHPQARRQYWLESNTLDLLSLTKHLAQ